MTLQDSTQQGRVVHVGLSLARQQHSIGKTSNGYIDLEPGGVIGDYHFQYKLDYDQNKRLHLNQYPELEQLTRTQGGSVIQTHQVSLFEVEEIDRLHSLGGNLTTIKPGWLGENITTLGIRLNEIRYGSIIVIGDVKLKVQARRSFCRRFLGELASSPMPFLFIKQNINELGEMRIGIMCQVLSAGRINVDDLITVYPNPELISTAWTNLPVPGSGQPTLDRVEYLPNE